MRPIVFVDTSGYVAAAKNDDDRHQEAIAIASALPRERATLFTSNFVIAETHAMLLRYLGFEQYGFAVLKA